MSAERRYSLRRLRAGDYLLPGNDGQTLWRIASYQDGPSHGLDWPRDRTLWGAWKYTGRIDWQQDMTADRFAELLDWNDWEPWDTGHETRREAIAGAIKESDR